jgi:3-deoxy-manno-octulosonate cytidylyltransferase (CMP-KDO synthetase)
VAQFDQQSEVWGVITGPFPSNNMRAALCMTRQSTVCAHRSVLLRQSSSCCLADASDSPDEPAKRAAVIIPARRGSRRFPAKPLAKLFGEHLVLHTLRRSQAAKRVGQVIVATDDDEIADVVRGAGGEVMMTPSDCTSGTERVSLAARHLPREFSVIINVQGDEPLVNPVHIDSVAAYLLEKPSHDCFQNNETVTLATPIHLSRDLFSPDVVKVVAASVQPFACARSVQGRELVGRDGVHRTSVDQGDWRSRVGIGRALYFSRAPIPYAPNEGQLCVDAVSGRASRQDVSAIMERDMATYRGPLRHVGMYGFRRTFLENWHLLPPSFLQETEDLEQLKWLEAGCAITVLLVDTVAPDVNVPGDIGRVEEYARRLRGARQSTSMY